MRSTEEWIGKTDDTKVPDYVRVRVFRHHDGICHITGRKIRPGDAWDLEHVKALCNGGQHRESNMAPALKEPHKVKTRADRREKADVDRTTRNHIGLRRAKGRPLPGTRASGIRKRM